MTNDYLKAEVIEQTEFHVHSVIQACIADPKHGWRHSSMLGGTQTCVVAPKHALRNVGDFHPCEDNFSFSKELVFTMRKRCWECIFKDMGHIHY